MDVLNSLIVGGREKSSFSITQGIMNAPEFKKYYASESDMDAEQKKFYHYWKSNWEKGNKISIHGQISYIFCYIYDFLLLPFSWTEPEVPGIHILINGHPPVEGLKNDYKEQTQKIIDLLTRIIRDYGEEEKLVWYCRWWLSDCYVLLKDYKKALGVYPKLFPNETTEYPTETLLNLKLINGEKVSGRDILTLNGAKVTNFGKQNLDKVAEFLEVLIREKEKREGINLLEAWKGDKRSYGIFGSSHASYSLDDLPYYEYTRSRETQKIIQDLTREAENTVREEMGIARIGEGWVKETELFYKIKQSFPGIEVIHHARPKWIGRQHLDIFIPSKKIAIEYQGAQHYRSVDFFGGEKGFKANQRRDRAKRSKCTKNRVRLIEISGDFKIEDVLKQILTNSD